MKYSSQFFTIITVSIFLLIAAIGVNSFSLTGNLMAQDGDLPYQRNLPKEFYGDDDYEEREDNQREYEEQEEQENTQPEDEDLTADKELLFDREKEEPQSKAAQVEKSEIKLNAELIKKVQAALNQKIKAGLAVDGVWGKKTDKAIKKFQQGSGLKTAGLDNPTLDKLGVTTQKP